MLNSAVAAHGRNGLWNHNAPAGWEYLLVLGTIAAGIGLEGPGRYSLDAWLGASWNRPSVGLVAILVGVIIGAATLAVRRPVAGDRSDERSPEERTQLTADLDEGLGRLLRTYGPSTSLVRTPADERSTDDSHREKERRAFGLILAASVIAVSAALVPRVRLRRSISVDRAFATARHALTASETLTVRAGSHGGPTYSYQDMKGFAWALDLSLS